MKICSRSGSRASLAVMLLIRAACQTSTPQHRRNPPAAVSFGTPSPVGHYSCAPDYQGGWQATLAPLNGSAEVGKSTIAEHLRRAVWISARPHFRSVEADRDMLRGLSIDGRGLALGI